jgi:hypothetical protein
MNVTLRRILLAAIIALPLRLLVAATTPDDPKVPLLGNPYAAIGGYLGALLVVYLVLRFMGVFRSKKAA